MQGDLVDGVESSGYVQSYLPSNRVTFLCLLIPGLVVCAVWWWLGAQFLPTLSDGGVIASVGGTIVSLAGSVAGLLLAVLAVIASISNTRMIAEMRRLGSYGELINSIKMAAAVFIVCIGVGIYVVLTVTFPVLVQYVTVWLTSAGLLLLAVILHRLSNMVDALTQ